MRINSLSFGNYNSASLVNNPPYITNYPFYEYMRDNKLDFDSTDLNAMTAVVQSAKREETQKDNFISGLFIATAGAVGVAGYICKNKLKAGYKSLMRKIKA